MKIWIIFVINLICCCMDVAAQVIENPVFDRTDNISFRVKKVELTKDTTYLYCSLSMETGSWANISQDTYLYDSKSGVKYPLIRSIGLPYSPQKRIFSDQETCVITLCFPPIGNILKFDLIESQEDRAFNVYEIDLTNSYEVSFHEVEIYRFENLASFYDSAGDTLKTIQYRTKEIEAAKYVFGVKSKTLYSVLSYASLMYDKYNFYEKAIEYEKQAGDIIARLEGKNNWNYALHLETLARYYSHSDNYMMSINNYKQSIDILDSIHVVDDLYALVLYGIACDYYEISNEADALIYQKKCIKARRSLRNSEKYINELQNILLTGPRTGRTRRIEIVLEELNNLPNFVDASSVTISGIYKQIASMYSIMENNRKAIDYCNIALGILKNCNNEICDEYAELLGLKCRYQQRCGLKDEAIASGEEAKCIFDSLNVRSRKYAELLGDLAWAYSSNYNYEKSIQLQNIAAAIYEDSKDWLSLAEVYGQISHYYQCAVNLENAEVYIKKAIGVLYDHDDARQYILAEIELNGNRYIDNPRTLSTIQYRIDIIKSSFFGTLARIYEKGGKIVDAINTEIDNGKILKGIGDTQMYAVHLSTLSEYYLRNNQPQEAIKCSEESIHLLSNDNRISLALPKLQLAIICFQAGDTPKSIRYAEESLSVSNSNNDIGSKISAQTTLSYLYWKNGQINKAENCLSDELDYLKNFISTELPEMTTEQKQRLWDKYEHNFLLYRNIVEKSDRNAGLLSKLYDYILYSKSLLLDSEIQQINNNTSRLNIKWKDIQKHLSNNAIAIEFISTIEDEGNYDTYHALVIDKESPSPKMITLYSESRLEELKKTEVRDIRDIVGELIWKPILEQYATVKDIYFSPDGILHMLPIEYYSADGTNSMFENYNMYRLSSTKELIWEFEPHLPNSAVLYGGLDYNHLKENVSGTNTSEKSSLWRGIANRGGFDPLFNTALETLEIKELLTNNNISTALYSGEKGTEESFRNLSGQNYGIIHLATHGMYINPDGVDAKKNENNFDFLESLASINDPVKEDVTLTHSFLVMAGGNRVIARENVSDKNNDGILTSKEISQLNLHGLDLVVLSACESALGDVGNGGVYGLQRGFKKAGANTIVMSLDKVDDEATRILMVDFYRNLMSGKTKHQSLKEAQKHLREVENGKYDDPKYWASFIMLDGFN